MNVLAWIFGAINQRPRWFERIPNRAVGQAARFLLTFVGAPQPLEALLLLSSLQRRHARYIAAHGETRTAAPNRNAVNPSDDDGSSAQNALSLLGVGAGERGGGVYVVVVVVVVVVSNDVLPSSSRHGTRVHRWSQSACSDDPELRFMLFIRAIILFSGICFH
ncbi:hypothetical protein F2P81_010711 [Scophthalmus maximus]|uniref:Uncharacterized protein n=1 Tax=Scophthalmus maximus TaxID=52904 RepID=A0A6A4SWD1_SCOMX|nr:hypothetical protein F2P81_010711 [Scophthalmus maximus]